jgi:SH3 domain-containing protein
VPRPRPRRALRPSTAVRVARVAVPLALVGLATSGVVAFAEPSSGAPTAAAPSVPAAATGTPGVGAVVREQRVSRDVTRTASPAPAPTATSAPSPTRTKRAAAAKPAAPGADDLAAHAKASRTMWATDGLNIRTDPERHSKVVTDVDPGTKLAATGTVRDGFRLVVFKGKGRWVSAKYVSKKKPDPAESGGVTDAACGKGSAMESGLTPDAVLVHRTVCARFPHVSSFGGTRGGGGFHATGQAVDCMISDSKVGWQLARWVRAHARELGVSEVIYSQHIWTVQRSGEGWRSMSDRGSATANHFDHVHVSVYGRRAG